MHAITAVCVPCCGTRLSLSRCLLSLCGLPERGVVHADDGSRYYNDSYNFVVYGGSGSSWGNHKLNIGTFSGQYKWNIYT